MFFSWGLWYARPREIKFSRRSRCRASGKTSRSEKSPSLSSTRDGCGKVSRGRRAQEISCITVREKETRWNGSERIQHEPTCCPFISVYLYSRGLAGSNGRGKWSERVRARLDLSFGLPSIELFPYEYASLVIRHRRVNARGSMCPNLSMKKCKNRFY